MPNKDFQNGYAAGLASKGQIIKTVEAEPIKSAIYNDDDTLDIVDKDDVEHEVVPTYTNNRITSITYDGTSMAVTYDGDGNLTKVGNCDIDGTEEYIGTGIVPSGSMNITENGTYDVTEKASAVVNVQGGGAGLPINIASSCPSPFLLNQNNLTSNVKYIFPTTTASIVPTSVPTTPYIQSSGTQWIDTGYIPKSNTKIVLKYVRNGTQSEESIFGTNWNLNAFFLMHYSGNLRWHGKTGSVDIPESGLTGIRQLSVYGTNITVNGTSYTVSGSGNDTQSDTLRIFGVRGNEGSKPLGQLKLYELKIYEYNSNTDSFDLVRNFVPAQSQEIGHENEACLYDNVTETYFYNQGTGTFTYGEDITPVTEIDVGDEVEINLSPVNAYATFSYQWQKSVSGVYIQASGSQYIDTGVTINSQSYYEVNFEYNETPNNDTWVFGRWVPNKDTMVGYYGGTVRCMVGGASTTYQQFDNNVHTVQANSTNILYDNVSVSIPNWNNVPAGDKYWIFWSGYNGHPKSKGRIYYVKIWNGDTLVRYFVPAISNETGHENEVCLYDNVTEAYFYNQGTGAFTYGTSISGYEDISGATSSTYTAQTGDNAVRCILTGTGNSEGTITSSSIEVQEVD